jgi:hypothetical protein
MIKVLDDAEDLSCALTGDKRFRSVTGIKARMMGLQNFIFWGPPVIKDLF